MELQKTKHQIKLEQWKHFVYECRRSELTVKEWCEKNHINEQTYYRWQKKVWESGTANSVVAMTEHADITFAEYRSSAYAEVSGTAVTIHIGQIRLDIRKGADSGTIESAIRAISKLC